MCRYYVEGHKVYACLKLGQENLLNKPLKYLSYGYCCTTTVPALDLLAITDTFMYAGQRSQG